MRYGYFMAWAAYEILDKVCSRSLSGRVRAGTKDPKDSNISGVHSLHVCGQTQSIWFLEVACSSLNSSAVH